MRLRPILDSPEVSSGQGSKCSRPQWVTSALPPCLGGHRVEEAYVRPPGSGRRIGYRAAEATTIFVPLPGPIFPLPHPIAPTSPHPKEASWLPAVEERHPVPIAALRPTGSPPYFLGALNIPYRTFATSRASSMSTPSALETLRIGPSFEQSKVQKSWQRSRTSWHETAQQELRVQLFLLLSAGSVFEASITRVQKCN